ncbi:hypothetical protein DH2020_022532 [Rehmannia glutinosa]|uniref:Uncharacterized protein n=1 Tax=Rehmannia glutinosa TaxID=99300 RepID=A0ABR0WDN0_REHGL
MFQVNMMLDDQKMEVVQKLELIDDLQRLGISYHFEDKINQMLNHIYHQDCKNYQTDLFSTVLRFRLLLRQHGFEIYLIVSRTIRVNSSQTLGTTLKDCYSYTKPLSLLVRQALELPLHWRIQRPNARWFMNAYERRPNMNPIVLELAKLDFNIVQATHQQELKHVSRWWEQSSLSEKLPFARDKLVECYLWTIGGLFEPQYRYSRIMATKVNAFITIIDDKFDVYGTLEELQLFNNVIQRWDIEGIDTLPNYMQICFLALNNFIDEMAYHDEMKRGDVPKSIQCYMNEIGADREEARTYIRFLINETWKKMNEEQVADSPFQQEFLRSSVDLGRMAQYMYQYGDGHGMHFPQMKVCISSLLFEPIVLA